VILEFFDEHSEDAADAYPELSTPPHLSTVDVIAAVISHLEALTSIVCSSDQPVSRALLPEAIHRLRG
jgi:hypothetical protein